MRFKQFLTESNEFKIYCDLDGVLTDFDGDVKKKTGKTPDQLDAENRFWPTIEHLGIDFWENMSWASDGKTLWNFIKDKHPTILSAPSRDPKSREGKENWIKRELGSTKYILVPAKQKQKYASLTSILIDDMSKNIEQWGAAGGIGILHTSAKSTIEKLEKILRS